MEKRSVLKKLVVILMLVLMLPLLLPATQLTCEPGFCPQCAGDSYDCTLAWAGQSMENMMLYVMACFAGVPFYVCCLAE